MKDLKKKLIAPVVAGSLIATSTVCALAGAANNSSDTNSSDSDNTTNLITSTDDSSSSVYSDNSDTAANDAGQSVPARQDGNSDSGNNAGTPPELPSGNDNSGITPPSGTPGGSNSSSSVSSYDAVRSITSDTTIDGESISSTGTDENVIDVSNNANVTVTNSTITRNSSNSTGGDNSSFYGVGAALLTRSGNLYVSDSVIQTYAAGGAGVFAYADGTAYVADSTITTTDDTSGGIHVAGGGKLYAWNLDVTTNGNSSAAIRSDRGGGTMVVDGGSYTSNGTGSPAVYCTADISINNADLTANNSEALCIEGLNTTRLFNCNLTGNMKDDSQNDCTWNVILYQSMSGDSQEGNSTFEMVGGSLTANNGGMFYTTNTESTFILSNVDITYADDSEFFLKCTGNSNQRGWGTTGKNGADCNFTAISQVMQGNVIWDSISQLDFYMTNGSTLTGAFVQDESNAGSGGDGYCNVYVSSDSSWTVTGDSTITNLYNAGTIKDADGNTVTIKGTDGTVYVNGTSAYTITVGSYSTSVDLSGASGTDSWSSYAVEKPSELGGNSSSSSSSGSNSGSSSGTISGSASGSSGSGSSSDSASASSGSDSSSGSASSSAGSDSSSGSASGSASSGSSSGSASGSTDTSSSGSNSTDSSNSSDTNPTTGDNAPIKIAASMGTIIIAAGAVYVVYNKKKRI